MKTGRPLVTIKAALTLDGKIAAPRTISAGSPAKSPGRTCNWCGIPHSAKIIASAQNDVLVVGTSAGPLDRRKALEAAGIQTLIAVGPSGRTAPRKVVEYLARGSYLSLFTGIIEELGRVLSFETKETAPAWLSAASLCSTTP